jgi:hypothetical protein
MMKFVVNQLPYYGELCPLWTMCSKNAKEHECPRYWDKYKVCSDENPHECEHLIETEKTLINGFLHEKYTPYYERR